jgi:hypothetical protein
LNPLLLVADKVLFFIEPANLLEGCAGRNLNFSQFSVYVLEFGWGASTRNGQMGDIFSSSGLEYELHYEIPEQY